MIWPFKKKSKTKELKNGARASTITPPPSPIPVFPEPDESDLRAQEILDQSDEACTRSAILDAEALKKLREAKAQTDTLRQQVHAKSEQISGVLRPKNGKTAQELALEALAEEEKKATR